MCGIWALLGDALPDAAVKQCIDNLYQRGPDACRVLDHSGRVTLGFTRLAVNGLTDAGMQPFIEAGGSGRVVCNGELYNYKELAKAHGIPLTSGSDCEVLLPLWHIFQHDAITLARSLDGVFAAVLVDFARDELVVMRDPYGVRPLYCAELEAAGPRDEAAAGVPGTGAASESEQPPHHHQGRHHHSHNVTRLWSSEVKGLTTVPGLHRIAPFPPGHVAVYRISTGERLLFRAYHAVPWIKNPALTTVPDATRHLRVALEDAVRKRLLSDRPIGCLLSGGLDSSLVAALLQRLMRECSPPQQLSTFSIGMSNAPGTDLFFAAQVAKHIGSKHHEVIVSEDDFFGAIPEVVAAIESFDITSVRASVGNYLVSKYIAEHTDIKVVFNGDGADEASGSYLYFFNAPTDEAFEAEVERLLTDIHMFDVLRSDRSISSHGLEARTPFLDKQFVAVYLSIATALRRPRRADGHAPATAEKQLLRQAFDDEVNPLLPHEVLWRRKEAFSDGVSKPERSWYQVIQDRTRDIMPDEEAWVQECAAFPPGPTAPYTRESLWYRQLFEARFGAAAASVVPYFWLPRWSGGATDPSARTLAQYSHQHAVPPHALLTAAKAAFLEALESAS